MKSSRIIAYTSLLVIGLSGSPAIFAQDEIETQSNLLTNEAPTLRFEHVKIEDGMAQGSANSIFQDSEGYIWIATQSGIHRYDGYEFKIYSSIPFDSTSLSSSWAWGMAESQDGDLWVTTQLAGVNKMDKSTGTFKHYRHDPNDSTSISSDQTFFPFVDSRGDLWVSTQASGLNRMRKDNDGVFERFIHDHQDLSTISSNTTFFVTESPDGSIWIGTGNGANRIDPETNEITRFLNDTSRTERYGNPMNVLDLYFPENETDMVWIATGNGLVHMNYKTAEYERYLIEANDDRVNPLNFIHQVAPDPKLDGIFWVSGPGTGVARFDSKTKEFTTYRHNPSDPNSLSENYVQSMYADRSGTIWVGYTVEGISVFNPGAVNFSHMRNDPNNEQSLSPGLVWGLYEDKHGILWAGTDAGPTSNYLTQYDAQTGTIKRHQFDPNNEHTLPPGNPRIFAEDKEGRFWVAGNGISLLDRNTGYVERFRDPEEYGSNGIFKLKPTASDSNKLWAGSFGGLAIFDTGTRTFTNVPIYPEEDETRDPFVISLLEKPDENKLWLATGSGLLEYDLENKTILNQYNYDQNDRSTLNDDVIFEIVERDEEPGIFWLATQSGGINRFDSNTGKATHFTTDQGLADNHIYGILEDDIGTLWMSTNRGIVNFDPDTETIRNYGLDDGLIALEYNQNAYFKNKDGVMYFGSGKGITAFVPGQLSTNDIVPQVVISDFKLFNKSVPVGPNSPLKTSISKTELITLPYNQNELTFDYVALHFANSNRNQYQYQLEGYDNDWIDAGTQRSATYTNLPPGEYTFQVKAANSDGVWNEQGASVKISILPPWYQTWWAYMLFGLMLAGFVFGVDRTQRRRISKKEQERTALREAEVRAEAENKRRADTEQLSKIGQTITSSLSVDEIIETVYENVNALMDAAIFGVGIYNKNRDTIDFPATKEKGEMLPSYSYNLSEKSRLAVLCFKNKQEIIISDFSKEHSKYVETYVPPVEGDASLSIIYLPLIQQNRVIGVITTQSFETNAYSEYHINLFKNLATYAAIALDNAAAYRQLNATLSELRTTQNQLVQQEKLASLGQLTAGIAHEIKNPLNFVNNFSDLNIELLEEAREAAGTNTELAEILSDIEMNMNKIHEHGTRADSIVKSMLLHSRGGSGEKELTDLNALIKEYANLAFHGMRAAKNAINVDINLDLDEDVPGISMIREDFSRVILNLCNNAFDAMREKLLTNGQQSTESPYRAKLSVKTAISEDQVLIQIEDNGPGIPDELKDKILQPFFTTKKGTEGTGLGLSITNDIIKAHGGRLEIDSVPGEKTVFTIIFEKG